MKDKNTLISLIGIVVLVVLLIVVIRGTHVYDTKLATNAASTEGTISVGGIGMMYANMQYGFRISFPDTFEATTTVNNGTPVIAFSKKGSNNISLAEVKIGISTTSTDVATCTQFEDGAIASTTVIHGTPFVFFEKKDVTMTYFSDVKSYRVVHENTCFAIDSIIEASNSDNEAGNELTEIVGTFGFK